MTTQPPRSLRNSNPGNLRYDGTPWLGLADVPKDDKGYCVFKAPMWGFRALARDLLTKYLDDNLRTVTAVITKFAPPSENPTADYIKNVCAGIGVEPAAIIDLTDEAQMSAFCRAVAVQEAGYWAFDAIDLATGVGRALATIKTKASP